MRLRRTPQPLLPLLDTYPPVVATGRPVPTAPVAQANRPVVQATVIRG